MHNEAQPGVNEVIAQLPGIAIHPHQPEHHLQGLLSIFYEMQHMLGSQMRVLDQVLSPARGGYQMVTAVSCIQGTSVTVEKTSVQRSSFLIQLTAQTPPAPPCPVLRLLKFPSRDNAGLDLDALAAVADETTAAMMIANPNTLGLFEADIKLPVKLYKAGGQMYYDGANFNAILGITSPGLMGFDAVHFNLHKTFSQPHGGRSGSGPMAAHLAPFLPGRWRHAAHQPQRITTVR